MVYATAFHNVKRFDLCLTSKLELFGTFFRIDSELITNNLFLLKNFDALSVSIAAKASFDVSGVSCLPSTDDVRRGEQHKDLI